MAAIITVTEHRNLPGNFDVKCDKAKGSNGRAFCRLAKGADEAAAVAMEYAMCHGSYVIFAPRKVLMLIPDGMQRKGV